MLCERCGKREATIHVKEETKAGMNEHYLCEPCAYTSNEQGLFQSSDQPMTIQQLLSNWFGISEGPSPQRMTYDKEETVCPNCQLSFQQFLKRGKFGCGTCYETFRPRLKSIFTKLHNGHTAHVGKVPQTFHATFAIERQIEEVREQMQRAVLEERFEDAALYRDEAKRLESKLQGGDHHVD